MYIRILGFIFPEIQVFLIGGMYGMLMQTSRKPNSNPQKPQTKAKKPHVWWGEVLHHECPYCSPPFMSVRASAPVKFSSASEVSVTSVPHSVPCSGTASLGFLSISHTRAWLKLYPVCSLSLHGVFFGLYEWPPHN